MALNALVDSFCRNQKIVGHQLYLNAANNRTKTT